MATLAALWERLPDSNQASRYYYALYSRAGANSEQAEQGIVGLTRLLLSDRDEGIQFGSGGLSFYRDVGSMDPGPGYLNGILSLVLNSQSIQWRFQEKDAAANRYFIGPRAVELAALLERRWPKSESLPALRAQLVRAFADYGDDDSAIRAGRAFLTAFPQSDERVEIALLVGNSLARRTREREEFALYDQLLRELARRSDGVPLGVHGGSEQPGQPAPYMEEERREPPAGPRSADYERVLSRYLSRLSSANRTMDAVRVYRQGDRRNPGDAGLYARFSAFLEQNGLAQDVEAIYRQAIRQFSDRSLVSQAGSLVFAVRTECRVRPSDKRSGSRFRRYRTGGVFRGRGRSRGAGSGLVPAAQLVCSRTFSAGFGFCAEFDASVYTRRDERSGRLSELAAPVLVLRRRTAGPVF